MQKDQESTINSIVLGQFPETQAIFLFGTGGTPDALRDSDVDIALLLPPDQARVVGPLAMTPCHEALERALERPVDLINLRRVDTVLRKEIIASDRRIYTGNPYDADEFEMLTLSFYQELNQERRQILDDIATRGRVLDV